MRLKPKFPIKANHAHKATPGRSKIHLSFLKSFLYFQTASYFVLQQISVWVYTFAYVIINQDTALNRHIPSFCSDENKTLTKAFWNNYC
jgi:hypothetical protein